MHGPWTRNMRRADQHGPCTMNIRRAHQHGPSARLPKESGTGTTSCGRGQNFPDWWMRTCALSQAFWGSGIHHSGGGKSGFPSPVWILAGPFTPWCTRPQIAPCLQALTQGACTFVACSHLQRSHDARRPGSTRSNSETYESELVRARMFPWSFGL